MQFKAFAILSAFLLVATAFINKPKKYHATVITALGSYIGEIKLDMEGSNKGLIPITVVNENNKQEGISVNAKLIWRVIIDSTTYYMADLDDEDKISERYLVKKVAGTDTFGLFSFASNYYVKRQNETNMWNINNSWLNRKLTVSSVRNDFANCKKLYQKMKSRQAGYYTSDSTTTQEVRLAVWQRLFEEYYNCENQ